MKKYLSIILALTVGILTSYCTVFADFGEREEQLLLAIAENKIADVQKILATPFLYREKPVDIFAKNENGFSCIRLAAINSVEVLKLFLEAKPAEIKRTIINSEHLLNHAVYGLNFDAVKYLLLSGADINAADDKKITALIIAATQTTSLEMVQLLISKGADTYVTMINDFGDQEPLELFARTTEIRALIEKTKNPYARLMATIAIIHQHPIVATAIGILAVAL